MALKSDEFPQLLTKLTAGAIEKLVIIVEKMDDAYEYILENIG